MILPPSPYPGLRPFNRNEADVFCGRSQHRIELLTKLEQARFLAVVGASGSGKSSLVMAGLWRDIDEGMLLPIPAGASRFVYFKPGLNPYGSLAAALAETAGLGAGEAERALRRSALGFGNALELAAGRAPEDAPEPAATVVVADQFEELFRFAALRKEDTDAAKFRASRGGLPLLDGAHNEAQAFVDMLIEAARNAERRVYVVLTMRSDFIPRCEAFDRLPREISANQYLTPRLQRDQLEAAAVVPLKYFNAAMDDELAALILNDLTQEQDQLPVLQHLLARLWRAAGVRGDRRLTVADYRAVGGVANALNLHGELILSEVEKASGGTVTSADVGRFFRCLAEFDPLGMLVRRPRTVEQVTAESGLAPDTVRLIADGFRARDNHWLTPASRSPGDRLADDAVLDLSHESLLRKWDEFSSEDGWLADERERRDSLRWLRGRMIECGWPLPKPKNLATQLGTILSMLVRLPASGRPFRGPRAVLREGGEPTEIWAQRYGWNWKLTKTFLGLVGLRAVVRWLAMLGFALILVALAVRNFREDQRYRLQQTELATAKSVATIKSLESDLKETRLQALTSEKQALVSEVEDSKRTLEDVQTSRNNAENVVAAACRLASGTEAAPAALAGLRKALALGGYDPAAEPVALPSPTPGSPGYVHHERHHRVEHSGRPDAPGPVAAWPVPRPTPVPAVLGPVYASPTPAASPTPTPLPSPDFLHGIVTFAVQDQPIGALAFLNLDGKTKVAASANDNAVALWSVGGNFERKIAELAGTSLRSSGANLLIAWNDTTARVWAPPEPLELHGLPNPEPGEEVVCCRLLPDRRLAFGTSTGRVGWWNHGNAAPVLLPARDHGRIGSLDFLPDRGWLLASSAQAVAALWSIPPGGTPRLLGTRQYSGAVFDVRGEMALIPNGTATTELIRFPSAGADGGDPFRTALAFSMVHQNTVVAGAFSPRNDLAATADIQGQVYLWRLDPVRAVSAGGRLDPVLLSGHKRPITALAWSPDGAFLVSADVGGLTIVWQNPAGRAGGQDNSLPLVLPNHQDEVTALAVSADGNFIASGGTDRKICVVPMHPTFAGLARTGYGGPKDGGLAANEGLSLFSITDLTNPAYRSLFLPATAATARQGLARRLDPAQSYVSAGWDYSLTSRSFLRANKVRVRNPANGKEERAQAVDWGPYPTTGITADLSEGLGSRLGLAYKDPVEVIVDLINPGGTPASAP